jgi:hypothetical protein
MIEGLSTGFIAIVIYTLGLPGAVLVMWYVDNRRYERQEKKREEELNKVLAAYHEDVRTVTRFYEDNVLLVKNYQKLADDLSGIIHLNTQVQTQLVEQIKHNMFCPIIREKGSAT